MIGALLNLGLWFVFLGSSIESKNQDNIALCIGVIFVNLILLGCYFDAAQSKGD